MTTIFDHVGWLERHLLLFNSGGFILMFSLSMLNSLCGGSPDKVIASCTNANSRAKHALVGNGRGQQQRKNFPVK